MVARPKAKPRPGSAGVHKCDLCAGCSDYPCCAMFFPTQCLTVERLG